MKTVIPVAAACIVNRQPAEVQVLLHWRSKPSYASETMAKWEFPGGKIRYGEKPEQTIEREIREELGITVSVLRLLHAQTNIYSDKRHYLVLYYECETSYEATPSECVWVNPAKVDVTTCLPGTGEAIRELNHFTLGVKLEAAYQRDTGQGWGPTGNVPG